MNFNSYTDVVIAVAVELVNVLTPGMRRGRPYRPPGDAELCAAVTAALRTGSPRSRAVTQEEAARFAGAAGELRTVFESVAVGDVDAAAGEVNRLLRATGARPQLERHDGEPWHLHFHGPVDEMVNSWAAGCATGLAVVLGSELYGRLGVCTASACDRVYVDVSRNGTRRFCSTACQNRVKTAAFRARRAEGTRPA
ncbi:MAG TPA: CGNR zinc finger domain-containing protein [Streptosporangiaceae bacterium]|nr:CGNR zinc finger domain-containing protein [Streptosporangiaceae bacterium]